MFKTAAYRALLAGLALYGAAFLADSIRHLAYPFAIDGGEGLVLDQARQLAAGETLYRKVDGYPYKAAHYPPVYPVLCALPIRLWGVSLLYGRLLSLFSTLGVAGLLYAWVRKESESREAGALAALLFLASPYVSSWGIVHRVDMLGLFFTAAGLFVARRGWNTRGVYGSIPLFLLAGLTKQTFLAAPLAVFIALLWQDRPRAWRWGAASAACAGLAFGALMAASDGHAFYHLVTSARNRFSGMVLVQSWTQAVRCHAGLFGLAFAGWALTSIAPRPSLAGLYMPLAALAGLGAAKLGSGINYFLELILAACLAASMAVARLQRHPVPETALFAWVLLALQLFCGAQRYVPPHLGPDERARITLHVNEADGPILSEDPGYVVVLGRPLVFHGWAMSQLHYQGIWDDAPVVRDLKSGRFKKLLLSEDVDRVGPGGSDSLTPAMAEAVRTSYRCVDRVGWIHVYAPK
ncbi:MAG TPA: glycosyltransferase family 39 protein [Planctomycetota bacterium]|nr:glycosyltransferase family 39 protein [Planctomycetota bacterium]